MPGWRIAANNRVRAPQSETTRDAQDEPQSSQSRTVAGESAPEPRRRDADADDHLDDTRIGDAQRSQHRQQRKGRQRQQQELGLVSDQGNPSRLVRPRPSLTRSVRVPAKTCAAKIAAIGPKMMAATSMKRRTSQPS